MVGNIGTPELLVILAAGVPLVIVVWGIIDAASRSSEAFQAAGSDKALWIALQAVGLLLLCLGWVVSVIYLVAIRPRVRAAEL